MSLFSFLRKNEQESAADDGSYYSRAEEDSQATRSRKRKSSARREEAMDPVLPEKKRARRRLVGAVALVLAAVIGLPMILDSEPRPLSEDIAIHIPSRDSLPPAIPTPTPRDSGAEALAASDTLDAREEIVAPTAVSPASPPAQAAAPAPAAPVAVKPTPTPTPPRAAAAPASTPTPNPASVKPAVTPSRVDDGARALALLEGRPVPGSAEKKAEKFVVQVAALVSQDKVNELQGTLKRAGIDSFTQKIATSGGSATRIRVGPFGSREEAEKMRARIVKLGLNGTLVPA